jgi:type II secretory pathway pseudopilin PulG
MKRAQGFTVIEVIVVAVFLGIAATLLLMQRSDLVAAQRDNQRKTAINAMYYNLEEVFYAKNGYYPSKIDETVLKAILTTPKLTIPTPNTTTTQATVATTNAKATS